VKQFETRRNVHDGREVVRLLEFFEWVEAITTGADGVPSPITEESAKALASAQQRARIIEENAEFGSNIHDVGRSLRKEVVNPRLNQID
jgi:hypothetical protein